MLDILSCGAVTAVGLDAFQTAAAFRAGLAGFEQVIPATPPREALRGARVPARSSLRTSPDRWLVNLAARAVHEALGYKSFSGRLALIVALPEERRRHPAFDTVSAIDLVAAIPAPAGHRFERVMTTAGGGAGIATGLRLAADLITGGEADLCVVGGVDSLLNDRDVAQLAKSGRMIDGDQPSGMIPGEGAGFVIVGSPDRHRGVLARIAGIGFEREPDDVLGPRFSQGRAFAKALTTATRDVPESRVSFRVSTLNGERYGVWESMFFTSRFYRTRRERLAVWYSASAVGEIGAASGAVALVLAAFGIAGGYAPGPWAMCEAASDGGLRSAVLVGPAASAPMPPFRAEDGASLHVRQTMQLG